MRNDVGAGEIARAAGRHGLGGRGRRREDARQRNQAGQQRGDSNPCRVRRFQFPGHPLPTMISADRSFRFGGNDAPGCSVSPVRRRLLFRRFRLVALRALLHLCCLTPGYVPDRPICSTPSLSGRATVDSRSRHRGPATNSCQCWTMGKQAIPGFEPLHSFASENAVAFGVSVVADRCASGTPMNSGFQTSGNFMLEGFVATGRHRLTSCVTFFSGLCYPRAIMFSVARIMPPAGNRSGRQSLPPGCLLSHRSRNRRPE